MHSTMRRSPLHSTEFVDVGMSLSLALFFASILSTRSIYAIAAGLLFLTCAPICLRPYSRLSITKSADTTPYVILLLVFLNGLGMWLYHSNALRQLDLLSRYALMIPILYALGQTYLKPTWITASFAIGSLSSLWLVYTQLGGKIHDGRVYGYTGAIQFGNIALLLGLFCLTALISQWRTRTFKYMPTLLYALGSIGGFFASLASGSRGGWIALPLALAVLVVGYAPRRYMMRSIAACLITATIIGALLTQSSFLQQRYNLATQDITQFQAGNANTSIGARLAIWQANWELIKQRPVLAWSSVEYQQALEQIVQERDDADIILGLANSHNNYIETWLYLGISGLILLLSLLVFFFFKFITNIRHPNPIQQQAAINGSILIIIYSIANLTQNMMERNNTLLFFLISLSTFWSLLKITPKPQA